MIRKITMNGSLNATNDDNFVLMILNDPSSNVFVIDVEEESDPRIDKNHPRVIGGGCLLPPMEGLIAAADGEHEVFRNIYAEHFQSPFVDNYISTIISSMILKGVNIIIYYQDELGVMGDFLEIFWFRYGIQIGIVGSSPEPRPFGYDESCLPIWLQFLYRDNQINAEEYLYNYPIGIDINEVMINKLIKDIVPIGSSYEEMRKSVLEYGELLKQNPNVSNPLYGVGS